jgi:hypothetical protein
MDHVAGVFPFAAARWRLRAFSEEVDTGSSKENAVNQELRAADLIQSDRQPL